MPLLVALGSDKETAQEVNMPCAGGLFEEGRALVSRAGVGAMLSAPASPAVGAWLTRLQTHERASLDAVASPTPANSRPHLRRTQSPARHPAG